MFEQVVFRCQLLPVFVEGRPGSPDTKFHCTIWQPAKKNRARPCCAGSPVASAVSSRNSVTQQRRPLRSDSPSCLCPYLWDDARHRHGTLSDGHPRCLRLRDGAHHRVGILCQCRPPSPCPCPCPCDAARHHRASLCGDRPPSPCPCLWDDARHHRATLCGDRPPSPCPCREHDARHHRATLCGDQPPSHYPCRGHDARHRRRASVPHPVSFPCRGPFPCPLPFQLSLSFLPPTEAPTKAPTKPCPSLSTVCAPCLQVHSPAQPHPQLQQPATQGEEQPHNCKRTRPHQQLPTSWRKLLTEWSFRWQGKLDLSLSQ